MLRGVVRKSGQGRRLALAVFLIGGLAACANPMAGNPQGPYASPTPAPAQAVIQRGCGNGSHAGPEATDVGFVQSSLIRQDAALQRMSDDITGAVPGGNPPGDAALARTNAGDIADLVTRSTLCSPFKEKLATAAGELVAADDLLVQAPGDQATLDKARAAFETLKTIAAKPPNPANSPSP